MGKLTKSSYKNPTLQSTTKQCTNFVERTLYAPQGTLECDIYPYVNPKEVVNINIIVSPEFFQHAMHADLMNC